MPKQLSESFRARSMLPLSDDEDEGQGDAPAARHSAIFKCRSSGAITFLANLSKIPWLALEAVMLTRVHVRPR